MCAKKSVSDEQILDPPIRVGWREWIKLPGLGLPYIKAKVDTGARTSCLHAFDIQPVVRKGRDYVRFVVHPLQSNNDIETVCLARVVDYRRVIDSGGHPEMRYVIRTNIILASQSWPIEITLTNRSAMRYRMLLGRTAMIKGFTVNPSGSYLTNIPHVDFRTKRIAAYYKEFLKLKKKMR